MTERKEQLKIVCKKLIGKDVEILVTKQWGIYSVSLCVMNLEAGYCNQLYRNFKDEDAALKYYSFLSELTPQDEWEAAAQEVGR